MMGKPVKQPYDDIARVVAIAYVLELGILQQPIES